MAGCELPRYVSVDEAAELLGVHPNTVRKMVTDGRLAANRTSERGKFLVSVESIRAFGGSTNAPDGATEES